MIRDQPDYDDQRAGEEPIQLTGCYSRKRAIRRGELMYPGKKERDRKPYNQQDENEGHCPVW